MSSTNAARLIVELARRGIRIEASGDRLRYRPRSAMTDDLAAQVIEYKEGILEILRAGAAGQSAGAPQEGADKTDKTGVVGLLSVPSVSAEGGLAKATSPPRPVFSRSTPSLAELRNRWTPFEKEIGGFDEVFENVTGCNPAEKEPAEEQRRKFAGVLSDLERDLRMGRTS